MKYDRVTVTTTTLILDENERQWLNSVMQNPLWGQHPTEEAPIDRHNREMFFNATKGSNDETSGN